MPRKVTTRSSQRSLTSFHRSFGAHLISSSSGEEQEVLDITESSRRPEVKEVIDLIREAALDLPVVGDVNAEKEVNVKKEPEEQIDDFRPPTPEQKPVKDGPLRPLTIRKNSIRTRKSHFRVKKKDNRASKSAAESSTHSVPSINTPPRTAHPTTLTPTPSTATWIILD